MGNPQQANVYHSTLPAPASMPGQYIYIQPPPTIAPPANIVAMTYADSVLGADPAYDKVTLNFGKVASIASELLTHMSAAAEALQEENGQISRLKGELNRLHAVFVESEARKLDANAKINQARAEIFEVRRIGELLRLGKETSARLAEIEARMQRANQILEGVINQ